MFELIKYQLNESVKKKKSKANILGWQSNYNLIKKIFSITYQNTKNHLCISKKDLFRIFSKPNLINNTKKYTTSYNNAINFLNQVGLIKIMQIDKRSYLLKENLPFPEFGYKLNFFYKIKQFNDLRKSPYLFYENLIKSNYYIVERSELYKLSQEIANKLNIGDNYNINEQQINEWIKLYLDLGAINLINDKIVIQPDDNLITNIIKYLITRKVNNNILGIYDVISFFEDNFYPVIIEKNSRMHRWFSNYLLLMKMRGILNFKDISDSKFHYINEMKFSHIEMELS